MNICLLFLCRQCCWNLHMLKECPMGVRQRGEGGGNGVTAARGARGHSPTSRHHCFNVTATVDTFECVLWSALRTQPGVLAPASGRASLLRRPRRRGASTSGSDPRSRLPTSERALDPARAARSTVLVNTRDRFRGLMPNRAISRSIGPIQQFPELKETAIQLDRPSFAVFVCYCLHESIYTSLPSGKYLEISRWNDSAVPLLLSK